MTNEKKIKLIIFAILFVVISPIIVLYANGDVFSNGWNLLKTGGIYVNSAPIGSEVYLNNKLQDKVSFFKREILIKDLMPGIYQIQIKKAGYNTWTKKLKVENNLVADADVFMLPEKIDILNIPKYIFDASSGSTSSVKIKNPEYIDTLSLFTSTTTKLSKALSIIGVDFKNNLGTAKSPIMNGRLGLWKEGGKIFVKWFGSNDTAPKYLCDSTLDCTKNKLVFELPKEPTEINFLYGYDGVILVSVQGLVFAIQIEENPDKTTQILYTGKDPKFKLNAGSLYVKDETTLSEIVL
jgi:hypothetical protein